MIVFQRFSEVTFKFFFQVVDRDLIAIVPHSSGKSMHYTFECTSGVYISGCNPWVRTSDGAAEFRIGAENN